VVILKLSLPELRAGAKPGRREQKAGQGHVDRKVPGRVMIEKCEIAVILHLCYEEHLRNSKHSLEGVPMVRYRQCLIHTIARCSR
jgi:hypothetical protein